MPGGTLLSRKWIDLFPIIIIIIIIKRNKRHMVVEAHLDDWMWLIRTTFYARSGGGG
jgi:hypothetical protein